MEKIIVLISLMLFLLTGTNLYSQEPSPPLTQGQPRKIQPDLSTRGNINAEDSNNTASSQMLTAKQNIDAPKKNASAQESGTEKSSKDSPITRTWDYDFLLLLFTGVLAFCNVILCVFNIGLWRTTDKAIKLARKEFIATHRPKLRVHSVCLEKLSPTPKIVNSSCKTHRLNYSVDNIGGSAATITKQSLAFKRLDEPLPVPSYCNPLVAEKIVTCGESVSDSFGVEDVLIWSSEDRVDDDLYFFGYIDYRDSTQTMRRTAFCRQYVRETKRFIKVEDEDYEYNY